MKAISTYSLLFLLFLIGHSSQAQENYKDQITILKVVRDKVPEQEKEVLKQEVELINERVSRGELTKERGAALKEEAARKRAMNIDNRLAIIDNKIELLERNRGQVLEDNRGFKVFEDEVGVSIMVNDKPWTVFERRNKIPKYDRRTYSDFVMALGLNNALIEGQSLNDSPYKIGGSRFFEIGWAWRTRVFEHSNFMRFNYGFSFQFNGLKPKENQYFVDEGDQTVLRDFELDLDKSKLRMDNLVFPLHFEFGPSRFTKSDDRIRYSIENQFRIGVGGYGGFNLGTRQKLKYDRGGDSVKDKLKRSYNTSDLIYGLSAYAGFDGVLLYVKYDLNPVFRDAAVEQHNISLGLRFDL